MEAIDLVHSPESTAHWFAVYTSTRHEKRVSGIFTNQNIETFLPLYKIARQWKKSAPVTLELPLFPNYVFVHIKTSERRKVIGTPGVLSIVGGKEPAQLPDLEIEALRTGIGLCKVEPHPYLAVGESVRITSGPFEGLSGLLVQKKNNFRVVVAIATIMKSVALEIDVKNISPEVTPSPR